MQTKTEMLEGGITLMKQFCSANGIHAPIVRLGDAKSWPFPVCAYYRIGIINICVEKCASIGRYASAWSYPGYTIDRTPYGVIAHELGHHIDVNKSVDRAKYYGDFSLNMRAACGEPPITSYCDNDGEWFAEIFRLFVTNPDLLKHLRPKTYIAIINAGLTPVETRGWQAVLEHAPQRTIDGAAKKIKAVQIVE